jgi:hypothetical protein
MDDPYGNDSLFSGAPGWFVALFVGALIVGGILTLMNWKKAADAGVNPLTMETEAMTTLINSKALASEKSIEERLGELDALHAKGTISAAELSAARAEVLKNP